MITEYSEFPDNVPRDRIVAECLDTVGCLGKGWGTEHITFIENKVFPTYSDAQRYMNDLAAGSMEGYAVLFHTYDTRCVYDDPVVREIRDEISQIEKTVATYKDRIQVGSDLKTPYITCGRCGSSLAVEYLRKYKINYCPLCHLDMRPVRDLARIAALEKQVSDKRLELQKAEDDAKRGLRSIGVHWLVQYKIVT